MFVLCFSAMETFLETPSYNFRDLAGIFVKDNCSVSAILPVVFWFGGAGSHRQ